MDYSFSFCYSASHTQRIFLWWVDCRWIDLRLLQNVQCALFFFLLILYKCIFRCTYVHYALLDCGRKLSQLACRECEYKGGNFVHSQEVVVHYIEVFCTIRTKNSVHCSELGGVHYVEVYIYNKNRSGGPRHAFKQEVFINGGFTVIKIFVKCFNFLACECSSFSSFLLFSLQKSAETIFIPSKICDLCDEVVILHNDYL